MKFSSKKREQGSILAVALFTSLAIGIVLASYLMLISSRYTLTVRSMGWNAAIPVLEAGLEEALTHLHDDPASPSANGWTPATVGGQPVYTKERHFTDGSKFYVTIYNATANNPLIYSQGFVPSPLHTDQYISRTVKVQMTTTGTSLFSKAILVRSNINLTAGMLIKSYDSSDTNLSNPDGTFNTNKFAANGWVASAASSGQSLNIAKSLIYGGIQYSAGATTLVNGGSVGDTAWVNGNSAGVQSGHADNTLNITIPATPLPTDASGNIVDPSTWTYKPSFGKVGFTTNGVTYAYILTSGDWSTGADTVKGKILIQGNARLYIPKAGRLQMGSGDVIEVSKGSSFQLYNDSSTDAVITGIANDSGLPTRFYYWGLPDTAGSKLSLTGGGFCAAAIYAYYQNVILTGGSGNSIDFYGALVASTVSSSGGFWMAFDQALSMATGGGGLVMSSWKEM